MRWRYEVIEWVRRNSTIRPHSISDRVPHSVDTEISTAHPESWGKGIPGKTFPKILEQMPDCEVIKYNIQPDHIHIVMIIPPKYAVSDVVAQMKMRTSSELRKEFGWLHRRYRRENVVWLPGFFVSKVGVEMGRILKYVEYQERHDSGQAKLEL